MLQRQTRNLLREEIEIEKIRSRVDAAEWLKEIAVPKAKNEIEFCYEQAETPDAQQKLDEIYNFIFGETIRLLELDKLAEVSNIDNNLRLNGDENA